MHFLRKIGKKYYPTDEAIILMGSFADLSNKELSKAVEPTSFKKMFHGTQAATTLYDQAIAIDVMLIKFTEVNDFDTPQSVVNYIASVPDQKTMCEEEKRRMFMLNSGVFVSGILVKAILSGSALTELQCHLVDNKGIRPDEIMNKFILPNQILDVFGLLEISFG